MLVSQKTQYALRAVFELSKYYGQGVRKIADIAKAQSIPPRFLEVILSQLKQAGFVSSQRGNEGGYLLNTSPQELTVGQVIQFLQGPVAPVDCLIGEHQQQCPMHTECVFYPVWQKVQQAISDVYSSTTFQDMLEMDRQRRQEYVPSYSI